MPVAGGFREDPNVPVPAAPEEGKRGVVELPPGVETFIAGALGVLPKRPPPVAPVPCVPVDEAPNGLVPNALPVLAPV